MPFINVRTVKGLLTESRKHELCTRLTDLIVELEGRGDPGFRQYVLVLIEEHDCGNWNVAGNQLTPAMIRELASNDSVA